MTQRTRAAVVEALEGRAYLAGASAELAPVLALTTAGGDYHDFATDSRGNFYLCGVYTDQTDFNPLRRKTYTLPGKIGWFVAKYRADGGLLWARGLEDRQSVNFASFQSITCDRYDNVIVAGKMAGTLDVDPGRGVRELSSPGDTNTFVLKLDPDGRYKAATTIDVSAQGKFDEVQDLAVSADGSVLLSGYWVEDFNVVWMVHATVTKLDARLRTVWVNQLPGLNGQGVAVDGHGNVLVTATNVGGTNVMLFNRRGRFVWSRNLSTNSFSGATFDGAGNAFVYGSYTEDFTVERDATGGREAVGGLAGYGTGVVLKFGGDGTLAWHRQIVGTVVSTVSSLMVDRAGFVHVGGAFRGEVDLDGGRGTVAGNSPGPTTDAFLATIDQSGRLLGGVAFGEADRDDGYVVAGRAARGGLLVHHFAYAGSSRTGPAGVRVLRVEE